MPPDPAHIAGRFLYNWHQRLELAELADYPRIAAQQPERAPTIVGEPDWQPLDRRRMPAGEPQRNPPGQPQSSDFDCQSSR
jgi:hypothetical protein